MSDRRRRRAKEDDSDEESQHSEVESGSEAGASNDEVELPSYDEAVKLEAENNVPASGSKREVRKPRVEGRIAKQDPSTVPRSERFFLHDDREGEKSGGMRSGRKFEGKSEPERPQRRYNEHFPT